jgi:hypothetical protein
MDKVKRLSRMQATKKAWQLTFNEIKPAGYRRMDQDKMFDMFMYS